MQMATRSSRALLLGALLTASTATARAQNADDISARARDAAKRTRVLAFTDTTSVRFEATIADGDALVNVPVRATITSVADGSVLWSGALGTLAAGENGTARVTGRVTGIRPQLWSPTSPALYRAVLEGTVGGRTLADTVRFGFRSFESARGQILLNGRPVFLRGNAINPPGRNLPDSLSENPRFAADYLRYMKGLGVNIIRLTAPSQVWFDAADEVGMMIFQGHYGTPKGGTPTSPPKDVAATLQWYRDDVLAPQVNHPSVVIYSLSNEQAAKEVGYLSSGHAAVAAFLQTAYDTLSRWDDTRLYIGNAGYGFGRGGEICDLHRYWGWYYNSFLSFYTLRDPKICWRSSTVQPMTLTENTGNYTGPDGSFNLVSNTKQPDSQLNWTGHAPEAEQSARALAYQAWMAGQAIEITRRLRERNPYLAGLSPFTIAFSNWHGATGIDDLGAKPVLAQYARSYQPVLLSWESWTPNAYAGSTISPVAHVVNDDDAGQSLRGAVLHWSIVDAGGRAHQRGQLPFGDVAYYAATSRPVTVALPASLASGEYELRGSLVRGRDTVSRNATPLFIAARAWSGDVGSLARRIRLFDSPDRRTGTALRALGVAYMATSSIEALDPARDALVVGSAAWTPALTRDTAALRGFLARGGRALVLDQRAASFDASWLPSGVQVQTSALDHPDVFPGGRPFGNGMAVNPERPQHPVFDGLTRDDFFLWSDHTGWTESKAGFPAVYPVTHGFALTRPSEMANTAVLANYDHGLQGVALAEFFVEQGSAVLSGFDLVNRATRDPVADRLLRNLVRYVAGDAPHEAHPLIESKIAWGDYASERGLLTGIHSGLLLHTVPRVPEALRAQNPLRTDDEGFVFAGAAGGWNIRPAIQYYGRGRRAFGPYEFSTGGSVRLPKGAGRTGEGRVWMRVPAGRIAMRTTVENPTDQPLTLEIEVNGATQQHTLPARATGTLETPIAATTLGIAFRGDRRLVLLETDFR